MKKIKLVYILSQRYSGSTLLSFLLGTHPEITTIGERRKFYVNTFERTGDNALNCSCGKPFYLCKYWNSIKEGLIKQLKKNSFPVNPSEFQFSKNRILERFYSQLFKYSFDQGWLKGFLNHRLNLFSEFNVSLVNQSLSLSGAPIFLDSSKSIEHALHLSLIEKFDLHIIWLTRDPRAQVNSALKYNNWNVVKAISEWKSEMKQNDYWLNKLGLKYVTLNYEALCNNPKAELEKAGDFLRVNQSDFSLRFRQQNQHIMGNYNMRLGTETEIIERKEWLQELSPQQIGTIESLTADYQKYYSPSIPIQSTMD